MNMMMKFKVNIIGLKEAIKNFSESKLYIANRINSAIYKASIVAVRNIKLTTPRVTGNLRRGIWPDSYERFKATIMPHNAPYDIYVHARNPFMKRGMDNSREQIEGIFSREVDSIIKDLSGK